MINKKNLHSEFLSWIGEREVTVDELHAHIHEQLGESYEIGDAGVVVNEMIVEGLLDVDECNSVCVIVKRHLENSLRTRGSGTRIYGKISFC